MKNKSIVFVYNNAGNGGAQKMLSFLASKSLEIFQEVVFIAFHDSIPRISFSPKVRIIILREDKKYSSLIKKIFRNIDYIFALRRSLIKINPSVICAFNVDAVMYSYLSLNGLNATLIGSERGAPSLHRMPWKFLGKLFYGKCDRCVFQTNDAKLFYSNFVQNKSIVIPNPYLGEKKEKGIQVKAIDRKKIIVVAAARIEKEKGIDIAILAFSIIHSIYPSYKLHIYGKITDNNLFVEYKNLVNELSLKDQVSFYEPIPNIIHHVKDVSLFLLPSRLEGIPNILLEALGEGLPTISTDCPPGGPRFLTDNGRRGVLVPVDDFQAMATEAIKVLNNCKYADRLSENALEVISEFDHNKIFSKWAAIFL